MADRAHDKRVRAVERMLLASIVGAGIVGMWLIIVARAFQ